jgi:murein DD-endopeptidase MepM/ murein hydrolase activator NlpD
MANPAPGHRITTPWGKKGSSWSLGYHTGADYAVPVGTRIVAAAPGKVVAANAQGAGKGRAFGKAVVIQHGKYQGLYAHLSRISVRPGQTVKAGDLVGYSGATGNVSGPHLHFEARTAPYRLSNNVNPAVLIKARGGGPAAPPAGKPDVYWNKLRYGQRDSDSVRALQRELNARVGAGLPITGNYLAKTKAAVAKFQRSQGWSGSAADGLIYPGGKETTRRLFPAARYDIRWQ